MQTKLFETNKTQAVRLPKAVAFPPGVTEVDVHRVGNAVVITPAGKRWTSFAELFPPLPDFARPEQPPHDKREFF